MKHKTIEVLIKYPSDFLSESDLSGLGMLRRAFEDSVDEIVREKVAEKILSEIEIPKIEIDFNEVKNEMITILAKKALEERE